MKLCVSFCDCVNGLMSAVRSKSHKSWKHTFLTCQSIVHGSSFAAGCTLLKLLRTVSGFMVHVCHIACSLHRSIGFHFCSPFSHPSPFVHLWSGLDRTPGKLLSLPTSFELPCYCIFFLASWYAISRLSSSGFSSIADAMSSSCSWSSSSSSTPVSSSTS